MKQKLKLIRESIDWSKLNYLLEQVIKNDKWEEFILEYSKIDKQYGILYESATLIDSSNDQNRYEIKLLDNTNYFLNINYLSREQFAASFQKLYVQYISTSYRPLLQDFNNTINATKSPIIHLAFEDSQKRTNITKELGEYVFSLIKGLRECIQLDQKDRHYTPDIVCYQTDKTEDRRLLIYKRYLRVVYNDLKNNFINTAWPKTNWEYLWKSL